MAGPAPDRDQAIRDAAARHGFSVEAVRALHDALERGGGGMAQFSHPELGGMGQWSRGGMLMIGDMFNDGLKARVHRLADDLTGASSSESAARPSPSRSVVENDGGRTTRWWPEELGEPTSSGGQNGIRYAFFPAHRRLAVEWGGAVTVHDTEGHDITGVSQQQGGATSLRFTDANGAVELERLPVVS